MKPQAAVTSAVLRALQTTRGIGFCGPIVVVPEAREVGGWPANSPIESREALSNEMEAKFGRYDWSLVATGPGRRSSHWESTRQIKDRARRLSRWLERRSEESLLLVSHGEFLQHLTGRVDSAGFCAHLFRCGECTTSHQNRNGFPPSRAAPMGTRRDKARPTGPAEFSLHTSNGS